MLSYLYNITSGRKLLVVEYSKDDKKKSFKNQYVLIPSLPLYETIIKTYRIEIHSLLYAYSNKEQL